MNKPTTAITAMGAWLATLCSTAALMSCTDGTGTDDADEAFASQALTPWSAPRLKWILYGTPGTAQLARRDLTTGVVSVLKTHAFATHWRPVSIAGNKLLWQRTDTGQVSLWTIDSAGNYQRHLFYNPPAAGYRAVSIALSDDGACPAMQLPSRTYVITFEGPAQVVNNVFQKPAPVLWMVDDAGTILSTDTLPGANNLFTTIRDFRPEKFGRWALLTVPNGVALYSGAVSYFDHTTGSWFRLRTDSYSASGGLTACTLDTLPPPFVNRRAARAASSTAAPAAATRCRGSSSPRT